MTSKRKVKINIEIEYESVMELSSIKLLYEREYTNRGYEKVNVKVSEIN